MSSEQIDFLYLIPRKFDPFLICATVLLMAPIAFLCRISMYVGALVAAIFVPIVLYGWIVNQKKRSRAARPALSLRDDRIEIPEISSPSVIHYTELKSILVEHGRGYNYFAFGYFRDGVLTRLVLDGSGLADPYDTILKAIADKVPPENNPRLGKGVLFCSPAKDLQQQL